MTATVTPDLVQQALSQTVPEVTQVTAESEAELAATTEEVGGPNVARPTVGSKLLSSMAICIV